MDGKDEQNVLGAQGATEGDVAGQAVPASTAPHVERVESARDRLTAFFSAQIGPRKGSDPKTWEDAREGNCLIDALIAAVRADQLDRVETVINVMPCWGNGHYIDVEHFRNKLSYLRPQAETVSPPLSEASPSVPSAAPKIVFCYGADAAIAALKDHSTVLHEGETTPGCTGRSAAPKEPS